jgi:hypothetical protein
MSHWLGGEGLVGARIAEAEQTGAHPRDFTSKHVESEDCRRPIWLPSRADAVDE